MVQPVPALPAAFPALHAPHASILKDGTRVLSRPAVRADLDEVNGLYRRCSAESRRARHLTHRSEIRPHEWERMVDVRKAITLLTATTTTPDEVIAMTNLIETDPPGCAELAVLVADAWQRRLGLGTCLVRYAASLAVLHGYSTLTAEVGATNTRMLAILRRLDTSVPQNTSSTVSITVPLPVRHAHHDEKQRR
ncbi:GNAT family N-acetyltransferase [Streptomyces montanus]|uniref:GNAT family N-acetyltransferase n=1 Tax=Streptomyces montanus TaxID=2580423 RepID=A0A5R9FVX8_9ACTN|nr:GNAT family N-acetyltransferase [Streptomyces montanus]TLS46126.1 GNAT family N-acetyltransferase [Streptomyces montanus]